jgi:hypothetical protein
VSEAEVAIDGDRVLLRAMVQLDDISGLGPLRSMLKQRERLETRGTLAIVRSGLAEYRITSARLAEIEVPRPLIPRLLSRTGKLEREPGVSEDGVPFPVPPYIGDVRVARGRVTLYRTGQ